MAFCGTFRHVFGGEFCAIGLFFYEGFALYHQLVDVLIPVLLYLLITRQPIFSTLKLNRLPKKKDVVRIFQLFLVSFLLKYGVNFMVDTFSNVDSGEVTMQIFNMVPNTWVFFVTVAVIPVILEEVLMRGAVLDHFRDTTLWQGSMMTGVLFAVLHMDFGQFGYTLALGVVMAAVVLITGSLWSAILFHFLNNFTSFAILSAIRFAMDRLPESFEQELESAMGVAQGSIPFWDLALMVFVAVAVFVVGVYLTIHYIKKMARENDYKDPVNPPSWKAVFLNLPMGIITVLYIGTNIVLSQL